MQCKLGQKSNYAILFLFIIVLCRDVVGRASNLCLFHSRAGLLLDGNACSVCICASSYKTSSFHPPSNANERARHRTPVSWPPAALYALLLQRRLSLTILAEVACQHDAHKRTANEVPCRINCRRTTTPRSFFVTLCSTTACALCQRLPFTQLSSASIYVRMYVYYVPNLVRVALEQAIPAIPPSTPTHSMPIILQFCKTEMCTQFHSYTFIYFQWLRFYYFIAKINSNFCEIT